MKEISKYQQVNTRSETNGIHFDIYLDMDSLFIYIKKDPMGIVVSHFKGDLTLNKGKNDPLKKFRGIVVPQLTPFNRDKSLNTKIMAEHVEWLCTQHVNVLWPMGGSGEYQTLNIDERKEIINCVVDAAKGRVAVAPQTGGASLDETIKLSEYAQERGIDAISVVIPTDIPDTEDAIFNYFQNVDSAVSTPILIYDPRGSGPHSMTPQLMQRMIDEFANIVAIKYRTTDGEYMGNMTRAVKDQINVLAGSETVQLTDLAIGTVGVVGGGCNFYPNLLWRIQKKFENGDLLGAKEDQFLVLQACEELSRVYWPLSGKMVMQEIGIPFELVTRVPAQPYSPEDEKALREYYRKLLKDGF